MTEEKNFALELFEQMKKEASVEFANWILNNPNIEKHCYYDKKLSEYVYEWEFPNSDIYTTQELYNLWKKGIVK